MISLALYLHYGGGFSTTFVLSCVVNLVVPHIHKHIYCIIWNCFLLILYVFVLVSILIRYNVMSHLTRKKSNSFFYLEIKYRHHVWLSNAIVFTVHYTCKVLKCQDITLFYNCLIHLNQNKIHDSVFGWRLKQEFPIQVWHTWDLISVTCSHYHV